MVTQPECRMRNPCQGEDNDTFRYASSDETTKLCHAPSNYKEAPFDIVVQDTKVGAKGGKKRCKQHPQWVATAADYDGGNDEKLGSSSVGHVATATHSGKC
jgi:hypothetical protein